MGRSRKQTADKHRAKTVAHARSPHRALSPLERAFVAAYLETGSMAKAAIAAGYSSPQAMVGGRTRESILERPHVLAYYLKARDRMAQELGLHSAEVHRELRKIINSDVTDFDFDEHGKPYHVHGEPGATSAIQSFRYKKTRRQIGKDGNGDPLWEETEEKELKMWNKPEMIALGAKITGLTENRNQQSEPQVVVNLDLASVLGQKKPEPRQIEAKVLPSQNGSSHNAATSPEAAPNS